MPHGNLLKNTISVQKVKVVLKNMFFRFFYYFCIENNIQTLLQQYNKYHGKDSRSRCD